MPVQCYSMIHLFMRTGDTVLHIASQLGLGTLVWQLLDHGAPVDARNADGRTALAVC